MRKINTASPHCEEAVSSLSAVSVFRRAFDSCRLPLSLTAKKQTHVIAISLGERRADVSTRLDFYSPSEVWTNSGCVGACVAAQWSWDTVVRHCPRTPNRPWLQSSLQETVRPPPIWKINNAGENLSAVSSLTTSAQPCPSWISGSSFYILTRSAVFLFCFFHVLVVLSAALFLNLLVIVLSTAAHVSNRVNNVKHQSLYKPETSNFITVYPIKVGDQFGKWLVFFLCDGDSAHSAINVDHYGAMSVFDNNAIQTFGIDWLEN